MRREPSFEEIVDRCIDDVQAGRSTVEECLARWPQWREDLEPVLQALNVVRSAGHIPERPVDAERRRAFMAAIRHAPQEPARRRPSLPRLTLPSFPSFSAGGLALRVGAAAVPAAAVALLAFVLLVSQGAAPASASTLTVFAGEVEVYRDGRWESATDGVALFEGDRIRTSASGWALLAFEDGSSATLDPATEVALTLAQYGEAREIILHQSTGRLWNDVASDARAGARYAVETPDTVVEATGTVFETSIQDGATTVITAQGLVRLMSEGAPVAVARGEMARAEVGTLTEHRAASVVDAAVMVRAPFVATLLSGPGAATGQRADGLILHQVPGVTTSRSGPGSQRFDLQSPSAGAYVIFLERVNEGDGDLVLRTRAGEQVIPLAADAARLSVRVEIADDLGLARLQVLDEEPGRPDAPPQLRVPERALARAQAAATALLGLTDTPTAADAGTEGDAEPGPPEFVLRAQAEREDFRERLDATIAAADREELRRFIDDALTADDQTILRMRMGVLTQVLGSTHLGDLMRDALTEERVPAAPVDEPDAEASPEPADERPRTGPPATPPGLADRLDRALRDVGPPAAAEHLERVIGPRETPGRGPGSPGDRGGPPGNPDGDSPSDPSANHGDTDAAPPSTEPSPTPTSTSLLLPEADEGEVIDAVGGLLSGLAWR